MYLDYLDTRTEIKKPDSMKMLLGKINDVKRIVVKPREEAIRKFEVTLKEEREKQPFYVKNGKKIKLSPINPMAVRVRLKPYQKLEDLYYLYSTCKNSKNFSSTFWWITKSKKIE